VFVNPACARLIEEGAGAFGVGSGFQEQVGIMAPDVFRFDLENREIVDTALTATAAALEAFRMDGQERPDPLVHLSIETVELAGQSFGVHLHGFPFPCLL
jgi:hypothetical protein